MEQFGVDAPIAEQDHGLALDLPPQIDPIHACGAPDVGLPGLVIAAEVRRVKPARLGHEAVASGLLDVAPRFATLLQLHQDLQVRIAKQRIHLVADPGAQAGDFLEGEIEHKAEPAPHGEHAVHALRDVIGDLIEHDRERRRGHGRLVLDDLRRVAFQRCAERLRHHVAEVGDDQLAERRRSLSPSSPARAGSR